MKKKPLPQFNSIEEAKAFYAQYGELIFRGRIGAKYEWSLYTYNVMDGRRMALKISNDGRVEELEKPKH